MGVRIKTLKNIRHHSNDVSGASRDSRSFGVFHKTHKAPCGCVSLIKALHAYNLGLGVNPNSAGLCNNLGAILCSMGLFNTALPKLDRAIKIIPQYAEAFNNRAVALIDLRRNKEALVNHDQVLAIKPEYLDALKGREKLLAGVM